MSEVLEQLYITDRDIFELIMSAKRRMTNAALLELTQDRKVFCSDKLSREELADYLSVLPHDHNDLATLIERAEPNARQEKVTFVELPANVTLEEVKDAIKSYGDTLVGNDRASVPLSAKNSLTAQFDYDELDYSRNRLAQRQRKQAKLEVFKDEDKILVRLPSSEKARSIVEEIRQNLASSKKEEIAAIELSLAQLTSPASRTEFFTLLINSLPGYNLQTVTSLRVATFGSNGSDDEFDDDVGDVRDEMLAVVNKVALGGENLIATEEFRQLSAAGFFIVAITWRTLQIEEPYDLMKISVSFDSPVAGNGIRYSARHATRVDQDRYSSSFKKLPDLRERHLLRTVATAANNVLLRLTDQDKPGVE